MKIPCGICGVLVLFAGMSAPAFGTTLPAGGDVNPSAASGSFTELASTGLQWFSFAGDTGWFEEQVGTSTGNPYGSNAMTFVYQFTVMTGNIGGMSNGDFANWLTSVTDSNGTLADFSSDTPTSWPSSAQRSADGSVVLFNFSSFVDAGDTSYLLMVNTNATTYQAGSVGLIDSGGETMNGFEPDGPPVTPEPSTLTLFGTGLVGLAVGLRKRLVRS